MNSENSLFWSNGPINRIRLWSVFFFWEWRTVLRWAVWPTCLSVCFSPDWYVELWSWILITAIYVQLKQEYICSTLISTSSNIFLSYYVNIFSWQVDGQLNQGDVSSISFCMGLLRFTSEILKEFDNQNSKASFLLLMSFIKKN